MNDEELEKKIRKLEQSCVLIENWLFFVLGVGLAFLVKALLQ